MKKILQLGLLSIVCIAPRAYAAPSIEFPSSFSDFSTQDVKTTIENIVRIILGFLGILVIVAIIYGGFLMMISRGDADKTGEGRKIVVAGAIGLVIVLAAYAIAQFIINSLTVAV